MAHYLVVEAGEDPTVHRFNTDEYGLSTDYDHGSVVVYRKGHGAVLQLGSGYWAKVELVEHDDEPPHLGPDLTAAQDDK